MARSLLNPPCNPAPADLFKELKSTPTQPKARSNRLGRPIRFSFLESAKNQESKRVL